MKIPFSKGTFPLVVLLVIVLVEGYGVYRFKTDRDALQRHAGELDANVAYLKRKYSEEKALHSGLMKTKAALEGQNRALQEDLEKLRVETASLQKVLDEDMKARVLSLQAKVDELTGNNEKLRKESSAREEKSSKEIQTLTSAISELTEKTRCLESDVKQAQQKLARCESHNRKLCEITEELRKKYEDKGVVSALLQKEPFTQIHKVQIEEIVQEYQDATSKHTIEAPKE